MKDVLRQVVLFHVNVSPDQFPQLLFIHRPPGAFHQNDEQIELFGGERHRLTLPFQLAGAAIQAKPAELINHGSQPKSIAQVFESIKI